MVQTEYSLARQREKTLESLGEEDRRDFLRREQADTETRLLVRGGLVVLLLLVILFWHLSSQAAG